MAMSESRIGLLLVRWVLAGVFLIAEYSKGGLTLPPLFLKNH
jgi:hypothetical protein